MLRAWAQHSAANNHNTLNGTACCLQVPSTEACTLSSVVSIARAMKTASNGRMWGCKQPVNSKAVVDTKWPDHRAAHVVCLGLWRMHHCSADAIGRTWSVDSVNTRLSWLLTARLTCSCWKLYRSALQQGCQEAHWGALQAGHQSQICRFSLQPSLP